MFGLVAEWGWSFGEDPDVDAASTAKGVARGELDVELWRTPDVIWDGRRGEIPIVTAFYGASVAFRKGADRGLDHFFGAFPLLPLGGEGEGFVVPYMPGEVLARGFEGDRLEVVPAFVEHGNVDRALGIGIVCIDETEATFVGADAGLADVGLRSWCLAQAVSGVTFVELWASDGRALWDRAWSRRVSRAQDGIPERALDQDVGATAATGDSQSDLSEVADGDLDEIAAYVRGQVAAGAPVDYIVAALGEDVDDRIPDLEAFVDGFVAAHVQQQRDWPEVTECDLLDRAFRALDAEGIVSRQPFQAEVGDDGVRNSIDAALRSGDYRGFVFYTDQSIEMLFEGAPLLLSFGARDERDLNAGHDIGAEIVAVLEGQGLAVSWSGEPHAVINVQLEWQRRRVA